MEFLLLRVKQIDSTQLALVLFPLLVDILFLTCFKLEAKCKPRVLDIVVLVNDDNVVLVDRLLKMKVTYHFVFHLLELFIDEL